MTVKHKKEIEISSLSTLKNRPNCPELSAPIIFRRPHGIADTDDKAYLGGVGGGYLALSFFLKDRTIILYFTLV